MTPEKQKEIEARNKKTVLYVLAFVGFMIGVAYASVPLYDLFCRVTGYGGTTQVADSTNVTPIDRKMTIRFRTGTARNMPWNFGVEATSVDLKVGEEGFINFTAHNPTGKPVAGTAVYNVTPLIAGKYFKKVQCFCFGEQILVPGQKMNMPVLFFVDPEIDNDPNLKDVKTITLSYTFFRKDSGELEEALEAFGKSGING